MDILDHKILCRHCNIEMQKSILTKDNFKIRSLICPKCHEQIHHPKDIEEYKNFQKLKQKQFQVKLRMVGNSYAVSIPREIIEYTEVRQEGRIVNMSINGPKTLKLSFSKVTKKIYHPKEKKWKKK